MPRRVGFLALVVGVAWLSGCAPAPVAVRPVDEGGREARYRTALAARLERAQGVEADASVWIKPAEGDALPGMTARLLLGQPDAFRIRVESLFGIALDLAARGDSVDAYVPPRRVGLAVGAAGDSLGLHRPGRLVWRAGSAAWDAPREAWRSGVLRDSVRVVRWTEGEEDYELEVGGSGLPVAVRVARGERHVQLRYARWARVDGVAWPSRVEGNDGANRMRVTMAFEHVRFRTRPASEQLTVRFPSGTERMTPDDLRRAWEKLSTW